ncbi:MAG: type II secretion system inner membrane protein GspF [Allosphingosinicella sp.]
MSDYTYVAVDRAGRERRGSVRANGSDEARRNLGQRHLYAVLIEPATAQTGPPLLSAQSVRRRSKLNTKQVTLFTRQLATLVQVSPLEEALRTAGYQSEKAQVRAILLSVHSGVVEGRQLSEALAREAASFPPIYRAMVSAGEGSGTLPQILERLADLLERQSQVRSKVITALTYPAVLALVAMFVVMALMIFVVPRVVEQFDSVGQQLPFLTRAVMGLSAFLADWWWALLLACGAAILLAGHTLRNEKVRLNFDRQLLRLPLIGRLIRDLNAARLARLLSTMVASRLPLLEGLKLSTSTVSNRALRAASAGIAESIRTGGSLSGALRRAGTFPPLLVYLAASGEASGRLDMMLERAADYLEREFDGFTASALSLLEPLIIILMGAVVAVIVLAILLPILQLDTMAGGLG